MKVHISDRESWSDINDLPASKFLKSLKENVYIIRNYLSHKQTQEIRSICQKVAKNQEACWHPCLDGVPDYHRLHNNYAKAHVKSVQHGFYFHPWNKGLLDFLKFREIFEFKLKMGGLKTSDFLKLYGNIPSDGTILRLVAHQYPQGGGGQQKHIDPVSNYARVQTLIMLSQRGDDYQNGGLYIEHPSLGKIELDPLSKCGDLILLSPDIVHGVDSVDQQISLDWNLTTGRWILLPIMLDSDHVSTRNLPKEL